MFSILLACFLKVILFFVLLSLRVDTFFLWYPFHLPLKQHPIYLSIYLAYTC
jgi:hypothetical protein